MTYSDFLHEYLIKLKTATESRMLCAMVFTFCRKEALHKNGKSTWKYYGQLNIKYKTYIHKKIKKFPTFAGLIYYFANYPNQLSPSLI